MAIQDSDPERRNLMVTSIAFIAYFYAGGSFPESSVRLQVINAEFSQPEILGVIAWSAFCWFIYRYWVTHRGNFASAFHSEFSEWQDKYYITNYINRCFGQQMQLNNQNEEYHASGIHWRGGCVVITCNYANVRRNTEGKVTSISSVKNNKPTKYIKLTDIKGWLLAFRASADCIVKRPSFSNYVVPYILVIVAILGAVYRHMF